MVMGSIASTDRQHLGSEADKELLLGRGLLLLTRLYELLNLHLFPLGCLVKSRPARKRDEMAYDLVFHFNIFLGNDAAADAQLTARVSLLRSIQEALHHAGIRNFED